MLLESKRKGRYLAGRFSTHNKNEDNLALYVKCRHFIEEYVPDIEAVSGFDPGDLDVGEFTTYDGPYPQFSLAGEKIQFSDQPTAVWFNYYERAIEIKGELCDRRIVIDGLNVNIATISNRRKETVLDVLFRMLVNWYMPNREVTTNITVNKAYCSVLPFTYGSVNRINVSVDRGTMPENRISGVKNMTLHEQFDDYGRIDHWSIDATTIDESGQVYKFTVLTPDIISRCTDIKFNTMGIIFIDHDKEWEKWSCE